MSFLVVYVWRGYKKSVYQKTIVETRYSITEVKQPVAARPKGGGRRPLYFATKLCIFSKGFHYL